MRKTTKEKVFLIILDGFGEGKTYPGNAIKLAKTPFINELRKKYPMTLLHAAGPAVGQPKGFMGNSEVGHFTIGAGRITWQSLEEINKAVKNGTFFTNDALLKTLQNVKKHSSSLHLVGMISDEGVHSQIDHLFELLHLSEIHNIDRVFIHALTDGRDVPEKSAKKYIRQIQNKIRKYGRGKIASIVGRYYGMDRDNNWDRTKVAFELMTKGKGREEKDPIEAIDHAYALGNPTDYYLEPMILDKKGVIKNNDSVIFFNYRTDRARQLTWCFTKEKKIPVKISAPKTHFTVFGSYSVKASIAFGTEKIKNNLGEIIDRAGLRQLRIAETEKYAHVTFFFNSQRKEPYKSETRILIDSPKVKSYDEKPEMSAPEITQAVLKEMAGKDYNLIVLNFANTDLVAHSGNMKATVRCVEILDTCLAKIIPAALKKNYHVILTSDHGNADQMLYQDGTVCPAHSLNPVPCILISKKYPRATLHIHRGLSDIAPTILDLLKMEKPKEMTGISLIKSS